VPRRRVAAAGGRTYGKGLTRASVVEAITLYLEQEQSSAAPLTTATAHVDEMRVLVSA
jgi:hypothetical protein